MRLKLVNEIIDTAPLQRILVVGDCILDHYIWGTTSRISPEAPVPVVDTQKEEFRLGGAGNVVHNLRQFGAQVEIASVVGQDDYASEIENQLKMKGVRTTGLVHSENRRTTLKTRIIVSGQQLIRIDKEERKSISKGEEQVIVSSVKKSVPETDLIILSDYQKGVLTETLVKTIIELANDRNIPVVVDPKGKNFLAYRGATLLTPNQHEMGIATKQEIEDESRLKRVGMDLLNKLALEAIIVTQGSQGMSLIRKDKPFKQLPTAAREVYDVSGAGDTVVAAVGIVLAAGYDFYTSAHFANFVAGLVVGKVGTATVTPDELIEAARCENPAEPSKVLPFSRLLKKIEGKRKGKKVVFTNGCFDLLHVGHVKFLRKARAFGDLLIVGLNTDDSIRRLKGKSRPLINEKERAELLASLEFIDYLVFFESDTPQDLIEKIQPDILVKGGDYRLEDVVGREFVESYGGTVELVDFVQGRSTSELINSILEAYRDPNES